MQKIFDLSVPEAKELGVPKTTLWNMQKRIREQEAYESYPENLKPIYKLLMYSGNRLSHVHKMLKDFDERISL